MKFIRYEYKPKKLNLDDSTEIPTAELPQPLNSETPEINESEFPIETPEKKKNTKQTDKNIEQPILTKLNLASLAFPPTNKQSNSVPNTPKGLKTQNTKTPLSVRTPKITTPIKNNILPIQPLSARTHKETKKSMIKSNSVSHLFSPPKKVKMS